MLEHLNLELTFKHVCIWCVFMCASKDEESKIDYFFPYLILGKKSHLYIFWLKS